MWNLQTTDGKQIRYLTLGIGLLAGLVSLNAIAGPTIVEGGPVNWAPKFRSGTWWGDPATPHVNQIWSEILNPTPELRIKLPVTYKWACRLPAYFDGTNDLVMDMVSVQVDQMKQLAVLNNPKPNTEYRITISPSDLPEGWHELSFKCGARNPLDWDFLTVTRVSFQVAFGAVTGSFGKGSAIGNYVDSHGWYGARNKFSTKDVGYQLSFVREQSAVVNRVLSGNFTFKPMLSKRDTGNVQTMVLHYKMMIDGIAPRFESVIDLWSRVRISIPGISEWMMDLDGSDLDNNELYDATVNTAPYCNGKHILAVHSHKSEVAGFEVEPGMQLATQVEVPFYTNNSGSVPCAR